MESTTKKTSWEIYDKPSKSAVPYVHTNPPGGDVEALDWMGEAEVWIRWWNWSNKPQGYKKYN